MSYKPQRGVECIPSVDFQMDARMLFTRGGIEFPDQTGVPGWAMFIGAMVCIHEIKTNKLIAVSLYHTVKHGDLFLHGIVVDPQYRGKGLSSTILKHMNTVHTPQHIHLMSKKSQVPFWEHKNYKKGTQEQLTSLFANLLMGDDVYMYSK